MKLEPIILVDSLELLALQISRVKSLSKEINIDFADGIAAPNKTITPEEFFVYNDTAKDNLREKTLDFDLMIKNWAPVIGLLTEKSQTYKIRSAVIHYKYLSFPLPPTPFELGVALDLEDEIDYEKIKAFPLIQIMTVDLGFQGTPFAPQALEKITTLRRLGYTGKIVIDGSVNDKTIGVILNNEGQADVLGVGSFFTLAENPTANFAILEKAIQNKTVSAK
jgi:pentose-5-phosphate-3-epimerase